MPGARVLASICFGDLTISSVPKAFECWDALDIRGDLLYTFPWALAGRCMAVDRGFACIVFWAM